MSPSTWPKISVLNHNPKSSMASPASNMRHGPGKKAQQTKRKRRPAKGGSDSLVETGSIASQRRQTEDESDSQLEMMGDKATPVKPAMSAWLKRFVSLDRSTLVADEKAIETEPMNDSVIANFSERCRQEAKHDGKDDDEPPTQSRAVKRNANTRVFIRNLRHRAKEAAILDTCSPFGTVTQVLLPRPRRLQGASHVVVTFEEPAQARQCAEKLNGALFDGQELEVSLNEKVISRQSPAKELGAVNRKGVFVFSPPAKERTKRQLPRYFGEAEWRDTVDRKRGPCFICAREGHWKSQCPAELCDICLKPGHHATSCKTKERVELCSACGAWGHSWKLCTETELPACLDRGAVCLFCGRRGHANCAKSARPRTTSVYCSWCAKEGHIEPACPKREMPAIQKRRGGPKGVHYVQRRIRGAEASRRNR